MSNRRLAGLVVCLGLVLCSSCSHPARQKLIGQWQVQFELTGEELADLSLTNNPLVAAVGQSLLRQIQAEIDLEFRADNTLAATLSVFGHSLSRHGTWELLDSSGDRVTIGVRFSDEAQPQKWTLDFQGDDTFRTTPRLGSGWQIDRLVTFRRKSQEPDKTSNVSSAGCRMGSPSA